ncbi:hypothetical protein ACLB2K_041750 [Fragaria x ananassa]
MEYDADDIFRDDEDDSDNEERASTKELVVYLVDASPKMFSTTSLAEDGEDVTDFHVAMSCISESLRKQIINSSYDEVAVCFFNTLLMGSDAAAPHASGDQITKASALINRLELKDFSVFQFSNPASLLGLQRHYAILQALALDEDDIPEIKDETFPPEEGMSRPAVVRVVEEFKHSIYGENYDEETNVANAKASETTKKRKAAAENAVKEIAKHDWADLADNGKLKNLTVMDLKCYLTANNLPVAGKEALISRILTHMGK